MLKKSALLAIAMAMMLGLFACAGPSPGKVTPQVSSSTLEVANFTLPELIELREVVEEVLAHAETLADEDERQLVNQAEIVLQAIQPDSKLQNLVAEKTEEQRLILDFLEGIFAVGAEYFYKIPSLIAGAIAKGAEELGNQIAEWQVLGQLGFARVTQPEKGVMEIVYQRGLGEVWASFDIYEPVGRICMYIPISESVSAMMEKYRIAYRFDGTSTPTPAPTAEKQVDIVAFSVSVGAPSPVRAGQTIPITFTICNQGRDPTGRFTTWMFLDNTEPLTFESSQQYFDMALDGNACETVTTDVTTPSDLPAGDYYVVIVADIDHEVAETDEYNNTGPMGTFSVINQLSNLPHPNQPGNILPPNGATGVGLTSTLESSVFSDPDAEDTHGASQWQITTSSGDYSSPIFDSSRDTTNLSSIAIPSGTLNYSTTYYWRVRHQDNHGAWSGWSTETSFTTFTPSASSSYSVSGMVYYSTTPLDGVRVELHELLSDKTRGEKLGETFTQDGKYLFKGVAPGLYIVTAWAPWEGDAGGGYSFEVLSSDVVVKDIYVPKFLDVIEPKNNSVVNTVKPQFRWQANSDSVEYGVTIYVKEPWTPLEHGRTTSTEYTTKIALDQDTKYVVLIQGWGSFNHRVAKSHDIEFTVHVPAGQPTTVYVPDDYPSVQAAVDAASPGDRIIVSNGTYTENIDVNKSLTIESENGADSAVIQAASSDDSVFEVTADYVTIKGFTVKGEGGMSGPYPGATTGIYLDRVQNCTIVDNILKPISNSTNFAGISLHAACKNTLSNNTALNCHFAIDLFWGSHNNSLIDNTTLDSACGIRLFNDCSDNTLTGNTMLNNRWNFWASGEPNNVDTSNTVNGRPIQYLVDKDGLVIDSSWDVGYLGIVNCTNIKVKDLTLSNNGQGLLIAHSNDVSVEGIDVSNNFSGIRLQDSSNNTLMSSRISNNIQGIRVEDSSNNTLSNNTISTNSSGVLLRSSSNNILVNNIFESHFDSYQQIGIRFAAGGNGSNGNQIYLNNFMNNVIDSETADSTNLWNSPQEITYTYDGNTYTSYLGNYWDNYQGSDADGDGIGDTPYSVNSDKDNYPLAEPFDQYEIE